VVEGVEGDLEMRLMVTVRRRMIMMTAVMGLRIIGGMKGWP
jgi:hypothetical protein